MAKLAFVNSSSISTLYIDIDRGDRVNRYAKWEFSPAEHKYIDETEIEVGIDKALPDALRSADLTVTEADIDGLSSLAVKNFIAEGLDIKFQTCGENITSGRLVQYDGSLGEVFYVATEGDAPSGIARDDGSTAEDIRIKYAGSMTGLSYGNINDGDHMISDTSGRLVSSATAGLWSVGICDGDYSTGEDITFVWALKEIGAQVVGRLNES